MIMGNILKDSSGNVLVSSGNAFEVTASVDSNITAGNIKKDVTILGVTGTYEGSGGGGFKCTNKILLTTNPIIDISYTITHQYTFSGTLQAAGLALYGHHGGNDECFLLKPKNSSSVIYNGTTITPGELLFQDHFCEPRYQTFNSNDIIISPSLTFTDPDLYVSMTISNSGLLTLATNYSDDSSGAYPLKCMVIFKGTDGTYDFDVFDFRLYYED